MRDASSWDWNLADFIVILCVCEWIFYVFLLTNMLSTTRSAQFLRRAINTSAQVGRDTSLIFKWHLTSLNLEVSFSTSCHTKAKGHSLPYYLSIAEGSIVGYILFLIVSMSCEIHIPLSRIWTWTAMSISCKHLQHIIYIYIYIYNYQVILTVQCPLSLSLSVPIIHRL